MYLTQLSLNRLERKTMKMLTDVYKLHQTILQGFSAYQNCDRVLFRVEPEERNALVSVLIQSTLEPDWNLLKETNQGVISIKTKEFSPQLLAGDVLRFRLRANPTVCREGKRYGLIRDGSLREWLTKKEDKIGAVFIDIISMDEGYINGIKNNGQSRHRVNLKVARFEGMVRVINPEIFDRTLKDGIGPAKAFGCGLLSLART
jgi:CRISPR system Cascade subunit CasE